MSGIFGCYYRDGRPVESVDLQHMQAVLAHRGPDGANYWTDGPLGLGHCTLHTTPESLYEQMPLRSRNGMLTMTADVRLDNRDELIAVLGLRDRPTGQIGDGELILAAYERWGEDCPRHLLGDFAFAIWDRHRQTWFCARDHMGVKPFYYYCSKSLLVFASELKALFCLPEVPRRVDEIQIGFFLENVQEDKAGTFYTDIYRLPPAHSISVGPTGFQLTRYWSLDATSEVRLASEQAYADTFRALFTQAVSRRLRSAFPIGCTLSGGLDSSSVACTARNVLVGKGELLHTFSAIFPGLPERDLPKIDERQFMQAVLATGGFASHFTEADRLSPLLEIERILWHFDRPFMAPNAYINWEICRTARQRNVRVMLDGCEGDITISHGFEYLQELLWKLRWQTLRAELRALAQRTPSAYTPRRILREMAIRPLIPARALELYYWIRARSQTSSQGIPTSLINPAFARRIALEERVRAVQRPKGILLPTARKSHQNDLDSGVLSNVADITDKTAAAYGLEVRHPFFDKDLVEYCLALPPGQKLHQGWTRSVMRRGMEGVLPPEVQWRRNKSNLSPNLQRKLLEYEPVRLAEVVATATTYLEPYIDIVVLRSAYERYIAQAPQPGDIDSVYTAVILSLWLQQPGVQHNVVSLSAPRKGAVIG